MTSRKQPRFPCVGIDLMFSPLQDDYVEAMGAKIYQAVCHDMSFSGLSFDVIKALPVGERLLIIVENQFQPREQLHAEVRWCKTISERVFRIGVKILLEQSSEFAATDAALDDIAAHDLAIPSGAELRCPACLERSVFELVANQPGQWTKGQLPLYNCSICDTTRTIPNILEFNRRFYLTELRSNRLVFKRAAEAQQSHRKLGKILYVEDDPDIQTVAKMAMELLGGFELEVCDDGYQALQKARSFLPDLFLLDMMIPGMTGIQTLDLLRATPGLEKVPAIFMTAKIQNHEIAAYKREGVLGLIPKPFDPMSLANDINSIWQTHSS
ncbi:response regulator [Methylomonas methanica]|uniref:Response regulator receiver modulated PilZ sensor protein n=1 Tax=Methylomonas methanica (strain DSM 25384 / MC09) TaxID=857087 RepID=G0A1N7_METMM|nr:response regulator [Methylomonas methanica]AEG00098.1 response regulator receiver modulated PilZ sensor protein [Methylomonas methanica MC09]